MKKLLLAMAVLGAAGWQGANAIILKANNNEFANVGLELQIWAQNNGKIAENDQNSTNFSVNNARVYFSGQVNSIVQFGADLDFADNNSINANGTARAHQGTSYSRVSDAFVNFKFMPQFQIMAGLFRDPVSKLSLTDRYTYVIPTGYGYGFDLVYSNTPYANLLNPFEPITLGDDIQNPNRDAGISIWGNVANSMLKYYVFAGNGAYDYQAGKNGKGNLKYGIRLEFTPTMLGYKNSSGFADQDTFLGALNNLTLGLGYEQQQINAPSTFTSSSLTAKYYDVDASWEQKFGNYVPQVQLGWSEKEDLETTSYGNVESDGYYVQLGALYDRVVGIGKPGIAIRCEQSKVADFTQNDLDMDRYGIFGNYYISGESAKVSFGADIVNPNSALKDYEGNGKSFTDWTLALQTEF